MKSAVQHNGRDGPAENDPNKARASQARKTLLRLLTITLLRQIESLESDAIADEVTLNIQEEVRRFEIELIRNALIETGGRQRQAARILGMKVTTLNTKIKRYQINVGDDSLHSGANDSSTIRESEQSF